MDWLAFFAKIIDSLACPITVAWVMYFFLYKHGSKLVEIVESIKYKDFVVMFRRSLDKAREQAERTLEIDQKQITEEEISEVEKIAKASPALAIVEIWRNLESEVSKLFIPVSKEAKTTGRPDFISALKLKGLISDNELELLNRLRKVRNLSVHTSDKNCITIPEIMEYKTLADGIIKKLKDKKSMWLV